MSLGKELKQRQKEAIFRKVYNLVLIINVSMKFEDVTVNSVSELITHIFKHREIFKKPVWYRGHSDKTWKLCPLIFRSVPECRQKDEMNLIKKFKQDATLLINPLPTNLYEWLFIMRHYGVPTRLLDWTESPLVGMYFTVNEDEYKDKDGILWAISPLDLNKQGGRELEDPENLPSFGEDEEMSSYKPEQYSQETMSEMLPIAFIAPRNTPRMQSQLSVFTIYHRNKIPINEIGDKSHLWRYIIPFGAKEKIKKELEALNFGKFQLFPELDKVGERLRGNMDATN